MTKEAGQEHNQGPLSQMMLDLKAKNREFGDQLYSRFKSGREETFIFPTSLSVITGDKAVDEFLVITLDGYKAIQIDTGSMGFANTKTIGDLIRGRLGKKPGFFSAPGYLKDLDDGTLSIGRELGRLFIGQVGTTKLHSDYQYDHNCRLVEIDELRVEEILKLNIERVRKIQATASRVRGVLRKSAS